jgi:hypothetical protein
MDVPKYNTDKVIGIFTGTLSVAAPTALQQNLYAEDLQTTGFNDTCLTQCVYSLDGGVTFNDDNMSAIDLSTPGSPVFQTCDVTSFCRGGQVGIAVDNWYNIVTGTGTARTIIYKIYCLAKHDQGILTPRATAEAIYFNSKDNYLKIYKDSAQAYTPIPAGDQTFTYIHDLGYVPNARAYMEYTTLNEIWPVTRNQYPATSTGADHNPVGAEIHLDETKMEVVMPNSLRGASPNINIRYRVYLDD